MQRTLIRSIQTLLCTVFILALSACSSKNIITVKAKDVSNLSQDASFYIQKTSTKNKPNKAVMKKLKNDYLKKHFSPWEEKANPRTNEVFWIKASLLKTPGFGEHLQANTLAYTGDILESMQIKSYPSMSHKAIITTTTSVRAVPTLKPMFNKENGYPLDRWQNSLIFAGTPVLITHASKDKAWMHIQSGFVYGWVESSHVGILSNEQIKAIRAFDSYLTSTKDKIPLYNDSGNFIMYARIGQIFPSSANHNKSGKVALIVYTQMPQNKVKKEIVYAPSSAFSKFPLALESSNIAKSINAMIGQRYGWGGLFENRDCSSFIRDIFAQYALYLPRNSKAQIHYGKNSIDLSKMNPKDKEAYIIANAIPFQSILWQSGHIMLYIGQLKGKAIIAHSAWSVTTGKRYENMLGGVVITTLHVGKEYNSTFNKSPLLIDKIERMSNLTALVARLQDKK